MAAADQQAQQTETVEVRRTFNAPRQRVFDAWTRAEEVKRWAGPGPVEAGVVEVDLRVGGNYRIEMQEPTGAKHVAIGTYTTVDPPKKLVYTWAWEGTPGPRVTQVTVEFHERGAGTEVLLRHEGLVAGKDAADHRHGWEGALDKLGALV